MRIGYCSPFTPMKSGISDFSEELVCALSSHIEIVIFSPVRTTNLKILEQFDVHDLSELDDDVLRKSLDLLVYQIGNNGVCHGAIFEYLLKYPGVVELHEIGLHNLMAEHVLESKGKNAYMEMVRYCHGTRGVAIAEAFFAGKTRSPWNEHGLELCMARPVIEAATAVIVHSDMVKQMVLGIRPDVPIVNIHLHVADIPEDMAMMRYAYRRDMGFTEQEVILGSFGFATPPKRILPILDALQMFEKDGKNHFKFVIVGEVAKEIQIEEAIRQRGLEKKVIITGFTSLERFKAYLAICDFCINLRYPTQGESSASLYRMFGMGIPAIVTDIGTFGDFPDEIVIKVRYDEHEVYDICEAVHLLATDRTELAKRSVAARRFAQENCSIAKNAVRYRDFFQQIVEQTWQPDYEDTLIGRLCELGLTTDAYTEHLWDAVH